MAHIVIDARIINSSTGRYVERLVTYLQGVDKKNQYSILVPKKDENFWKPTAPNFTVRVADFDNYSLNEQFGLNAYLNDLKPDLVHFCMPQQPVGYKGKKVTTFHDLTLLKTYNSDKNWLMFHIKQKLGALAFKKITATNDHIIAVSNFTKKELQAFTPVSDDKISVIYEAADVADTKPEKYQLPFKKYILYVGQQSDYKNIKRLGDAHQLLKANHPDLGLVLAGKLNAAAQKNKDYFERKGYSNILFTDFVSDAELSWLYAHAEAYVFPSLMEGFGLPGLEAMGHGTPVVSSNATCLPEVYGKAAFYFDPTDSSDIANAIDALLADKELQRELVAAGYKRLKKFSWKKMAKQTHAIYQQVLNSK